MWWQVGLPYKFRQNINKKQVKRMLIITMRRLNFTQVQANFHLPPPPPNKIIVISRRDQFKDFIANWYKSIKYYLQCDIYSFLAWKTWFPCWRDIETRMIFNILYIHSSKIKFWYQFFDFPVISQMIKIRGEGWLGQPCYFLTKWFPKHFGTCWFAYSELPEELEKLNTFHVQISIIQKALNSRTIFF